MTALISRNFAMRCDECRGFDTDETPGSIIAGHHPHVARSCPMSAHRTALTSLVLLTACGEPIRPESPLTRAQRQISAPTTEADVPTAAPDPICRGDREVRTDAQIQGIAHCIEITGSLTINDRSMDPVAWNVVEFHISSLAPLENLRVVGGQLEIAQNADLKTLMGLHNLTEVAGDLTVALNPNLGDLTGLSRLDTVGGGVRISDNTTLRSLRGLEGFDRIDGDLELHNNKLSHLDGLSTLRRVNGDVVISAENGLKDLSGLVHLKRVSGTIEIAALENLENISGVPSLRKVGDDIEIWGNPRLSNLDGLMGIKRVGGYISVVRNDALTDVTGAIGGATVGEAIEFHDNDQLCRSHVADVVDQLVRGVVSPIHFTGKTGC